MNLRELDQVLGEKKETSLALVTRHPDNTVSYAMIDGVPVRYFINSEGKLDYVVIPRQHGHFGAVRG